MKAEAILRPKPREENMRPEGFENGWKLIRETASSQKFRVTTEETKIEVDIHYTAEKILTVNLVVEGSVTKSLLTPQPSPHLLAERAG
jgi:hypothetical protein